MVRECEGARLTEMLGMLGGVWGRCVGEVWWMADRYGMVQVLCLVQLTCWG